MRRTRKASRKRCSRLFESRRRAMLGTRGEHGHAQLAGEVVLAAEPGVEPVAQERQAGAEEEREDEHDRRVERRPRPHGRAGGCAWSATVTSPFVSADSSSSAYCDERLRVGVGELGRLLGRVALRLDHEELRVGDRAEGQSARGARPPSRHREAPRPRGRRRSRSGSARHTSARGPGPTGSPRSRWPSRCGCRRTASPRPRTPWAAAADHVGGQGRDEDRQNDDPLPSPEGDEELIRRQVTPCSVYSGPSDCPRPARIHLAALADEPRRARRARPTGSARRRASARRAMREIPAARRSSAGNRGRRWPPGGRRPGARRGGCASTSPRRRGRRRSSGSISPAAAWASAVKSWQAPRTYSTSRVRSWRSSAIRCRRTRALSSKKRSLAEGGA